MSPPARRPRGTGSIIEKSGSYYGRWYDEHGTRRNAKLGAIRQPGTRDGLTRSMAEKRLREVTAQLAPAPIGERYTIEQAGERLITHLRATGRKRSTVLSYEGILRVHLVPYFGSQALQRIDRDDVEALMAELLDDEEGGLSIKTVLNVIGVLSAVMEFAIKRGWANQNPVRLVDKPRVQAGGDIRFLDRSELEALLAVIGDDDHSRVLRVMYLTAAWTGLRLGELLALRWIDVDWPAQRIRVRRSWVRGEFGSPKSKRSTRSVPLADLVGGELDRLFKFSAYVTDEDLVFAHPHTGRPMNRNVVYKHFKRGLARAGVRDGLRFHDLRHTFATTVAASGRVSMRTLQEWMGHRHFQTTLIYADYMPGAGEAELINDVIGTGVQTGVQTERNSTQLSTANPSEYGGAGT